MLSSLSDHGVPGAPGSTSPLHGPVGIRQVQSAEVDTDIGTDPNASRKAENVDDLLAAFEQEFGGEKP